MKLGGNTEKSPRVPSSTPQPQILIAEDLDFYRNEFYTTLSKAGYRCELATTFEEATEKLDFVAPQALVLDLKLESVETGRKEFYGWLLAKRALDCNVPIIIVTAYPTPERVRKAFRTYGVVDCIDKAEYNADDLVQAVSEAVKASQRKFLSGKQRKELVSGVREAFFVGLDEPKVAAVRDLVRSAFTAQELRRFCQDRPDFEPLLAQFSIDAALDDMTDVLIVYCRKRVLFRGLLEEIRRCNPRMYERHQDNLYS